MIFLGFKSKLDFRSRIWKDLSAIPFHHPFQHPLLETLFLREDWCRRSMELLLEMKECDQPLWFMRVEAVNSDDDGIRYGPHLFVHYPSKIYAETRAAGRSLPVWKDKATGTTIADGWLLRDWEDCVRSKTVRMFEAKVKVDMWQWCRDQLETHRSKFPVCEVDGCGKPADRADHLFPSFEIIAERVFKRARSNLGDMNIPKRWFTQSRHFWPDYPDGFRGDFLAECATAKLRSLCYGCRSKPGMFRQPEDFLKMMVEDEEMAQLMGRRRASSQVNTRQGRHPSA